MVRSLFPFLLQKRIKKHCFSTNVPLHSTIYHGTKARVPHAHDRLLQLVYGFGRLRGRFDDRGRFRYCRVVQYRRYFNWLKPPTELERNSNYHLFKSDIEPMWEEEANAKCGKRVLTR